jgi:hypothetical protein
LEERDTILEYILIDTVEIVWLCGTNVEFKYRSIFREVGKVLVYPRRTRCAGKTQSNYTILILVAYRNTVMLENIPINGMHSCGILISEEPITIIPF